MRRAHYRSRCVMTLLAVLALSGSAYSPASAASVVGDVSSVCPSGLPPGTACASGRDSNGAFFLIAIPPGWNHRLVVNLQGGPQGRPILPQTAANLGPIRAPLLARGYAVATSSGRDSNFFVRRYAEDHENLRLIFVSLFGAPDRVVAFGGSLGGLIATLLLEQYGANWDGGMTIAAVNVGLERWFQRFADLRYIYQYYCGNLPLPTEPSYPLYFGLHPSGPTDITITNPITQARMRACTGYDLPAPMRTPVQQTNYSNILRAAQVTHEGEFEQMMFIATNQLRRIVMTLAGGATPFPNLSVRYSGSDDDVALNAGIARYEADPGARQLVADENPTGVLRRPLLTLHSVLDTRVPVESEDAYRRTVAAASESDGDDADQADDGEDGDEEGFMRNLAQFYSAGHIIGGFSHSGLATSEVMAGFLNLMRWLDTGRRPHAADVSLSCTELATEFPEPSCGILSRFHNSSYDCVVPPRDGSHPANCH